MSAAQTGFGLPLDPGFRALGFRSFRRPVGQYDPSLDRPHPGFAAVYGMGLTLRWVPAGQSDVQDLSAAVDCSQCGSVANNSKAGAGQRTNCPKYKKTTKDEIHWVRYSEATRKQFMECGRPVFVDYTAKWCVSCQRLQSESHRYPKSASDLCADRGGSDASRSDQRTRR